MKGLVILFFSLIVNSFHLREHENSVSYFPLESGRTWLYRNIATGSCYSLKVGMDTTIGSVSYSIIEYQYPGKRYVRYYSLQNQNLYMKETPLGQSYLYLPCSDSLGVSFNVDENGRHSVGKLLSLNDSIILPTGKEKELLNLQFQIDYGSNLVTKNYYFKKDVGLIAVTHEGKLNSYLVSVK